MPLYVLIGGTIGVLLNGAQLYSAYGGTTYGEVVDWETTATYAEGDTFDECGCHSSSMTSASYHCHVPPGCLLNQLGYTEDSHSPQGIIFSLVPRISLYHCAWVLSSF